MDGIPGAETGSELQARAIAFLMNYYEKDEFSDIIVSHAGFLRCLINTAKGLPRTTPVDSKNGAVTILEEPLEHLEIEMKDRAMASKVWVVNSLDEKYVIKQKDRNLKAEDYEEKRIVEELSKEIQGLPSILYMSGTENRCKKILKFVEGETIFGKLDAKREKALVEKVKIIREILETMETAVYAPNDIYETVRELGGNAQNRYVRQYAERILKDTRNKRKLENSDYVLVHNDLNRDNILFEENKDGLIEANIIDWEGVGLYPEEYSLASFLTTAFLIEGYSVEEVMRIANQFDETIDRNFVTYLMKIRIFKGLYFFAENRNVYTRKNAETARQILKKYFLAAERLEDYRSQNQLDVICSDVMVTYTNEEREEI